MSNNHLIVMAGGVGSRLWPMSTPERPKQFIDVLGCGRTLLQLTGGSLETDLPVCTVYDKPRFGYRAGMIDVSRHFFGVDVIKKS